MLNAWDEIAAIELIGINIDLNSSRFESNVEGYKSLVALIHRARHAIRLNTVGPLNAAIGKGAVFDYFDELRGIVERSTSDIFFVDPYLDANFVARYLQFVPKGTQIRLLGRKGIEPLLTSVDAFAAQHGISIALHATADLHDRYVFVDGKECFQSGASFKDGAVHAPTTLTQITDAFSAMAQTYERLWDAATIHR